MTIFGQIVMGPPGSGKTKYCSIMQEVMSSLGRQVIVCNLDPANDHLYYDCQINVFELINIQDVMLNCHLGPNGALIYCMEFLESNIDWLVERVAKLTKSVDRPYLLFDMPGQVELYTHHKSVTNIIRHLEALDYRLCSVNLVDSYYAADAAKFIGVLLMSLSSMLQIELPHVNILSKMDLINQYGKLQFNLDVYTDVLDLNYLVDTLDEEEQKSDQEDDAVAATDAASAAVAARSAFSRKFKKLNRKICDVVQDFSLVAFSTLNIQKKASVIRCIQQIDRANGYMYGHLDDQNLMNSIAASSPADDDDDAYGDADYEPTGIADE